MNAHFQISTIKLHCISVVLIIIAVPVAAFFRKNITMAIDKSCFQFPCSFPLKVMGLNNELFELAVKTVFETFVQTEPITYTRQCSSTGRYVSITITFTAVNREQLDALYRALNNHELVVMAL